jgi:NADH-quinone oxidoreductase subunit C
MSFTVADDVLAALGDALLAVAGPLATDFVVAHGELNLQAPAATVAELIAKLRGDPKLKFEQLVDVCGCDYPDRPKRFEVVYHLLSLTNNRRVRIKVQVAEGEAVPSLTPVFESADWYEREVFDMFGVPFDGHPDLRRLLTDYGFQGHPLRKDFPMTGYVEVRYDDEQKRVVYEPVKIVEFRNFDFLSPWEGAQGAYVLPGDEKKGA